MRRSIAVIGAGASGMISAIAASKGGAEVSLFDTNKTPGKKLLMTGNGRCNFTNYIMDREHYLGKNEEGIGRILSKFGLSDTIDFFKEVGIEPKRIGDLVYPYSLQAKALRDRLWDCIKDYNVKFIGETKVSIVKYKDQKFNIKIDGKDNYYDAVILACGGKSYPKTGSDGSGYAIAKSLGHSIKKPLPALTSFETDDNIVKAAGVRIEAVMHAQIFEHDVAVERGELQITPYGLSGIAIMNLSNYLTRALDKKRSCSVVLDLMPDFDCEKLESLMKKRINGQNSINIAESMVGLFADKIIPVILKKSGVKSTAPCTQIAESQIKSICSVIKAYTVDITGIRGFEQAQVTDGGVPLSEINTDTFGSLKCPGLYIAGEMLDVTGLCGGYNLQWAWTSGFIAGSFAAVGE